MERPELAREIGRDVKIIGGPRGFLAYYGPHKTKTGYRAGVVCDEYGVGKNNGIIGGRRYFTCKPNQGLLVDPKKIRLLPGDKERKKEWVRRAIYCRKLDRAFAKLVARKLQRKASSKGAPVQVWRRPGDQGGVGKLFVKEVAKDDGPADKGPMNRPILKKGVSVLKMEAVLKKSRKSVKKGGINKYAEPVQELRSDRDEEIRTTIQPSESPKHKEYEDDLLRRHEETQEEMRGLAARRASEVTEIKAMTAQQEKEAEEERLRQEEAEEEERLSKEEEAALEAALEAEREQDAKEHAEVERMHAELEEKVGVSQLSLNKTGNKDTLKRRAPKHAHPMLEHIEDFLASDGFLPDE